MSFSVHRIEAKCIEMYFTQCFSLVNEQYLLVCLLEQIIPLHDV